MSLKSRQSDLSDSSFASLMHSAKACNCKEEHHAMPLESTSNTALVHNLARKNGYSQICDFCLISDLGDYGLLNTLLGSQVTSQSNRVLADANLEYKTISVSRDLDWQSAKIDKNPCE